MPVQVPLQAVPSQTLQIVLNGQNCQIDVYMSGKRLYVDVALNDAYISIGVIARNLTPIVPTAPYSSFAGNLVFLDTQGSSDPSYAGLASRYQLLYLTAADYAAIVAADA